MVFDKKKKLFLVVIVSIILLIIVAYKINDYVKSSTTRPKALTAVLISNPERKQVNNTIDLTGDILPYQQATIYSRVSGNIEKIFVDIGSLVKKGDILAVIDSTIYSQNARQAYGLYLQAEANYQNAKMNYERNLKLFEQNLIAKQEVDNAYTAYEVAKGQKESQQANYKNALTQLNYCKIIAPFAGYITKRFLDPGAYVTSSANSPSSSLFTLMDISKVKILVNLPEKNITILEKVKEADICVDAYKDKIFKGKVERISDALDPNTRTLQVEIDIDNKDRILKPGMFGTVSFLIEKKDNAMVLPLDAVLKDDYGKFVYVFKNDSTVSKTYVNTGIQKETFIEILGGVSDKDKIVVVGQTLIKDKMKVRIAR